MAPPGAPPKPFIIPVFIPHAGCPHRCLFCNQTHTTGQQESFPSAGTLYKIIAEFLKYRRSQDRWTEIAFFGGNLLGLPADRIAFLMDLACDFVRRGQVNGIRFSTRPDTIQLERLDLIRHAPVTTVELGAQSMQDDVLAATRRGHTADDTRRAVSLLKAHGYRIGLQMMVGLPGDNETKTLESGRQMALLAPDAVRIYPTLVLKESALARLYAQGRYTPLSLAQSVAQVKALYAIFTRKQITVIRMGLQPTAELNWGAGLVAGPFHPAFGELVHGALWLDALRRHFKEQDLSSGDVRVCVNPSIISRLKGQKNCNIRNLTGQFGFRSLQVIQDDDLPPDTAMVNGSLCRLYEE